MHSFAKKAPHASQLLANNDLGSYINTAGQLAKTVEAIKVYEVGNYKDFDIINNPAYKGKQWSPKYFGSAIEFLAECFLEVFGAKFNIMNVKSTDDYDDAMSDGGVDHYAVSMVEKNIGGTRVAKPLSPVYIQTKGVLNPRYEFSTNDGARLPNFFMNAQVQALKAGAAYSARYVLFTTGKGLHYKLDQNSGQICEVINYSAIKRLVDNNVVFWNTMREKMGVSIQEYVCYNDPEAILNRKSNDDQLDSNTTAH